MLDRHFDSAVKAVPGLCLDIHTKRLMEAPSSEGTCIVFQEHPGQASSRFPRPVSHEISSKINHVDLAQRKIPLGYLEQILDACSTRGAAIGGGKNWYRVAVRESNYGGQAYYLRVLDQDQDLRSGEKVVTHDNLTAIKDRIAAGASLDAAIFTPPQQAASCPLPK